LLDGFGRSAVVIACKSARILGRDWNELRTVVTNHGPKSQERLDFRRANWEATQWVRDAILGSPRVALA